MGWFLGGVVVVAILAWPVLHGALLAEGVRVLSGRRAPLGSVVAAVVAVPLLVAAAQLGIGCVTGAASAFTPVAIGSAAVSVAVGLAVRAFGYASILRVPAQGAFGLAVGVAVVNVIYGGALLTLVGGSLWMSGLLSG